MSIRPAVDTLFDGLLDFREMTVEDINRTLGKNVVEPVSRIGFPNSLPRKTTKTSLGGMEGTTYPVSYVVRMVSGNTEQIRTLKTATRLMSRTAQRFAAEVRRIPNSVVMGFQSLQCGFNTWATELLMKEGKGFLWPKWSQGMLEWIPEKDRPAGVYFPSLSMVHSINKIPGRLREFLSISRLEENYMDWNGHKITPVLAQLRREGRDIILIDDTLNTGTSLAFQARILERFHIPEEKIHLLALVNERGVYEK